MTIIGFLVLIPLQLHGQEPAGTCGRSISPYTEVVLERIDAALQSLPGRRSDPSTFDRQEALRLIDDSAKERIDITLRLTGDQRAQRQTMCLRADICQLQTRQREILDAMHTELERQSFETVRLLGLLATFVDDRIYQLTRGALDPTYKDQPWVAPYDFDTEEEKEKERTPLCPYDSRFGPATRWHGCTPRVLDAHSIILNGESPTEKEALEAMFARTDTYLERSGFLVSAFNALNRLLGRQEISVGEKRSLFPARSPEPLSGCLEDFRNELLAQVKQDQGALAPGTEQILTVAGMTTGEVRGAHSLKRDPIALARELWGHRQRRGERRNELKEYEEGSAAYKALETWLNELRVSQGGKSYENFPQKQGEADSTLAATLSTSAPAISSALQPLRKAVGTLTMQVSDIETFAVEDKEYHPLRGFIRDFAWYLRRSCIFRPCNEKTERAIRAALTEECFAVVTGSHGQQSHDACRTAVEEEEQTR